MSFVDVDWWDQMHIKPPGVMTPLSELRSCVKVEVAILDVSPS